MRFGVELEIWGHAIPSVVIAVAIVVVPVNAVAVAVVIAVAIVTAVVPLPVNAFVTAFDFLPDQDQVHFHISLSGQGEIAPHLEAVADPEAGLC